MGSYLKFKIEAHNVFTKETNKIPWNSKNDKRLLAFDRITSYPYGASVGKVCKTVLLEYLNTKWLILVVLQTKTKQNIIENGYAFLTIHAEY